MSESASEISTRDDRLKYLIEIYKMYHGHINAMFNFFLIVSGLIGNACILSLSKQAAISKLVPAGIGFLGALTSLILLLVHIRSRLMMDVIEGSLEKEELELFGSNGEFLLADKQNRKRWYQRHRYQFRVIYMASVFMFAGLAVYSFYVYLLNPST